MSDDQTETANDTDHHGFAETPSKVEWLGLLRDLSEDLAAMEQQIEFIKAYELAPLKATTRGILERVDMIKRRLSR